MWRAYSKEVEIKEYTSAIEYLIDEFRKNQFEWEHEEIYGMGRLYTENHCKEEAQKYSEVSDYTEQLQDGKISITCWASKMEKYVGTIMELYHIKKYLPHSIQKQLKLLKEEEEQNIENCTETKGEQLQFV